MKINWTPTLRSTNMNYWKVYDAINQASRQGKTHAERFAIWRDALKYYGWTEKNYHDASDTAMEIQANTQ